MTKQTDTHEPSRALCDLRDLLDAAPEMLAALKAVKRRICFIGMPQEAFREDGAPDWRKEIAMLEAAIAKAEGR
jgi:hypothetical protein